MAWEVATDPMQIIQLSCIVIDMVRFSAAAPTLRSVYDRRVFAARKLDADQLSQALEARLSFRCFHDRDFVGARQDAEALEQLSRSEVPSSRQDSPEQAN